MRYAAQSLLCAALQKAQRSPPFGSQVVAQGLGHDKIKYPEQRSIAGRLLFWDHLADQGSYLLCPPEGEHDDPLDYKAGLPVLSPPDVPDSMLDAKAKDDAREGEPSEKNKKKFDTPLLPGSDEPLDLDPTGEDLMETFAFLYLSSEDCRDAVHNAEVQGSTGEEVHATELSPDNHSTEEEKRKQATTHINVTSDEVYKPTGETRQKWLSAGENAISNLTSPRSGDHKTGARKKRPT